MKKAVYHAQRAVFTLNRVLGRFSDVIWVVGDGRSGTTWLTEILQTGLGYRTAFEPIHPVYVDEASDFPMFPYLAADERDPAMLSFLRRVFRGEAIHPRVAGGNRSLLYAGLLVKDIFANLLLAWAHRQFPDVRKVMILRHPFAVAVSKMHLSGPDWLWMDTPEIFLDRQPLFDDHLQPFEETIRTATTPFERLVTAWAVVHYVPFRQLQKGDILITFYEELVQDPGEALQGLLEELGVRDLSLSRMKRLQAQIAQRSRTTPSDTAHSIQIDRWKKVLSREEIDRGYTILDGFGLTEIYGHGTMPNRVAVEALLQ
ncbi:MAG: sulfotransferase [Rubricoccaceae bacterium]|nr:sulfotransferase [Rubricoccaceae bacterium]